MGRDVFSELPLELQSLVFSYEKTIHRVLMHREVCRGWKSIIESSPRLWAKLTFASSVDSPISSILSTTTTTSRAQFTTTTAAAAAIPTPSSSEDVGLVDTNSENYNQQLQKTRLKRKSVERLLMDNGIGSFVKSLSYRLSSDAELLFSVLHACVHLVEVDFSGCNVVTDCAVGGLVKQCGTSLQKINITGCIHLTEKSLNYISAFATTCLTSLSCSIHRFSEDTEHNAAFTLCKSASKLQSLSVLSFSSSGSRLWMKAVVQTRNDGSPPTNLTNLDLRDSLLPLEDDLWKDLAVHCRGLKTMRVSSTRMTDENLHAMANVASTAIIPSVRGGGGAAERRNNDSSTSKNVLERNAADVDQGAGGITSNNNSNNAASRIATTMSPFSSPSPKPCIFPFLQELDLSYNTIIGNTSLLAFVNVCPTLSRLNVTGCILLEEKTLNAINECGVEVRVSASCLISPPILALLEKTLDQIDAANQRVNEVQEQLQPLIPLLKRTTQIAKCLNVCIARLSSASIAALTLEAKALSSSSSSSSTENGSIQQEKMESESSTSSSQVFNSLVSAVQSVLSTTNAAGILELAADSVAKVHCHNVKISQTQRRASLCVEKILRERRQESLLWNWVVQTREQAMTQLRCDVDELTIECGEIHDQHVLALKSASQWLEDAGNIFAKAQSTFLFFGVGYLRVKFAVTERVIHVPFSAYDNLESIRERIRSAEHDLSLFDDKQVRFQNIYLDERSCLADMGVTPDSELVVE